MREVRTEQARIAANEYDGESSPPNEIENRYSDRGYWRRFTADGQIILGDSGFTVAIEPGLQHAMAMQHEQRRIVINPDRVARLVEGGGDEAECRYLFAHEIAHIVQLYENPSLYIDLFERERRKARLGYDRTSKQQEIGNLIRSKRAEDADDESIQVLQQLESKVISMMEQAWGEFNNVFLDMGANAIAERRGKWNTGIDEHGEKTRERLYKKLTKGDERGAPKHLQFLWGAMRYAMLGNDKEVQVDDDARAILDEPFTYMGKKYPSMKEYIKATFFNADTSFTTFVSKLERVVSPIFERLLLQDVETIDIDGYKKCLDQFRKSTSIGGGATGRSNLEDLAKQIQKFRRDANNKAVDEGNKRLMERMKEAGFSEGEVAQIIELYEKTSSVFMEMRERWGAFIQKILKREVVTSSGFRNGHKANVGEFIRQYARSIDEPDRLRIFDRRTLQPEVESIKPRKIRLCIVADLSGSMDYQKRRALQEAFFSIAMSLVQFGRDAKSVRDSDIENVEISVRAIGFGSYWEDILDRTGIETPNGSLDDSNTLATDTRMYRAALDIITKNFIGTRDAEPLESVIDGLLTMESEDARNDGREVDVVIEVTDGDTETVVNSRRAVDILNSKHGVYARGIRIPGGGVDLKPIVEHDQEIKPEIFEDNGGGTFFDVWGKHGRQLDKLEDLNGVMFNLLFKEILAENTTRGLDV